MTTPVWPATLPQVLRFPIAQRRQSGKLRTETDTGPAKVRRRFTARVTEYPGASIQATGEQKAIFDAFYDDDLGGGSLAFSWTDPDTRQPALLRIKDEPEADLIRPGASQAKRLWEISFTVEVLP
ncbi:hypothetical protein LY622_13905 [Halomonas sp. M5N1S17]|uniref:hypothetical protein n=1 Tax=Halomonas alkalisoli TaxID=2907158 RepID=UPI001F15BF26|nr:hypothetical protein [Halomonas alkalisoli]MCE9664529.1 hypothetical protein [Halomonas alkalisoli]